MLQQTMLDVTIEIAFRSLKRPEKDTSSSRYTVREIAKPRACPRSGYCFSGGRCASSTTFRPSYLSKKETACVRAEGATVSSIESPRGCVHMYFTLS